jgi:Family of unknown function (DUF6152)
MSHQRWMPAAAAAVLLVALPAIAHHASAPFYDASRKVEAEGRITRFVFRNPHAFLYLEATDASGKVVEWQVELGAPVSLTRAGWTPDTLKPGTVIKVVGQPSRAEGTHGICCARITRPDGSPIVPGGRVQEDRPPQ